MVYIVHLVEEYTTDITIHAPAEIVWEALTTSALVHQYLSESVESTWQVGAPIIFRNTWEGQLYQDKGYILAVQPCRLLKYTYLPALGGMQDKAENYQEITWELTALATVTTVKISQTNIKDPFFAKRSPELWGEILRGLKHLTEQQ